MATPLTQLLLTLALHLFIYTTPAAQNREEYLNGAIRTFVKIYTGVNIKDVTYLVFTGAGEMRGKGGGREEASQRLPPFGHDNSMGGMEHTLMMNMA